MMPTWLFGLFLLAFTVLCVPVILAADKIRGLVARVQLRAWYARNRRDVPRLPYDGRYLTSHEWNILGQVAAASRHDVPEPEYDPRSMW